ncbi:MAG: alkaline phosphatase, partial [Hyphomicrobiaceae bacterium]
MKSNTPKTCFTYGFAALLLCVTGLPATVGADSAIKEKPVARSGRSNAVPLPAPREVAGTYAKALEDARALRPIDHQADSAIIFIGDGMGMSTVTAARILAGQREGRSGEEGMLAWEHLPSSAFVKTFNTNQQVADSAGTATAIFTGHRTNSGVLGIGPSVSRGDCEGSKRAPLASLFELATGAGLATGVVTDTRITHATPAAAYAHTPERDWESNLEMPEAAREAGCKDIATQLVDANIDVVFGGGLRAFLPQTDFRQLASGGGSGVGERTDGRNLVQAWLAQSPDRRFITDKDALDKLDPSVDGAVLGLFAPSHLAYRYKRANTDQPSLTDMTTRAIELLQSKSKRWLLLVE